MLTTFLSSINFYSPAVSIMGFCLWAGNKLMSFCFSSAFIPSKLVDKIIKPSTWFILMASGLMNKRNVMDIMCLREKVLILLVIFFKLGWENMNWRAVPSIIVEIRRTDCLLPFLNLIQYQLGSGWQEFQYHILIFRGWAWK